MPERALPGRFPWLLERAQLTPAAPALRCGSEDLDWTTLARRSEVTAGRLAALGVGRGDRVALVMEPSARFVELIHAAQRIGAALVPVHPRLAPAEVAALLADAAPRLVLHDTARAHLLEQVDGTMARASTTDFDAVAPRALPSPAALDPGAPLTILYTSGTTGTPKGAVLTNEAHAAAARASRARLGAHRHDRWLAVLPLCHVGGLAIVVRGVLDGVPVILHPGFDAGHASRAIRDQGVTLVSLVATMLARMLDHGLAPIDLRCVLVGGGLVPPPLLARAARAGVPVSPTYGLTEAGSQVATAEPGEALARPGTSGRALPGTHVRIEAPGRDGVGEILVRGPTLMTGYFGRPEATARAMEGGWLHTGDLGRLDEAGRLFVYARRSDLVLSGGENVYPAEVEAVLVQHPAVAEAAVFPEPDREWGQRVAAAVVLRPGAAVNAAILRAWCAARLARFKVPRTIRLVTALPRTPAGKLRRHRFTAGPQA